MERFEEDSNINPARRDLIRSVITQQPSSPLRKRPYADDWDAEAQKRPREENRVRTTVRNRSWINPELKRKGMMDSRFSNKKSHVYTQLVSPLNNLSPGRSSVSSHEESLFLTQSPGEILHSATFSPSDSHHNTAYSNGVHRPTLKQPGGSPQSDTAMKRFSPSMDPRRARPPPRQESDRSDGLDGYDRYEPRPKSPTASRSSRNPSPGSLRRSSISMLHNPGKRKRSSPPPRQSPPPPPARSAATATAGSIGKYFEQLAIAIGNLSKQEIDLETKKEVEQKLQSEGEKLRKAGGVFMSLDERQEDNTKKLKWHTTRLNQKLDEHRSVKEGAVQSIAASLLAASHGELPTDREDNNERIRAVEKELKLSKEQREEVQASLHILQTEMKTLDRSLIDVKAVCTDVKGVWGQLGDLSAGSRDLKSRLSSAERSIANIRVPLAPQSELVALSDRLTKTEQDTAEISGLGGDVKAVQDKVDTLAIEVEDIKAEGTKLKNRVAEQEKLVSSLKEVVFEDATGLVDVVSNADRSVDNFREEIKSYGRDLDVFQQDLKTHNDRLAALESNHPIPNTLHASHSSSSQSDRSSCIIQLEAEMSGVKRDLKQLTAEQEAKDDMIGDENDLLHKEIGILKTDYAMLKSAQDNLAKEVKSIRDILGTKEAVGASPQRSGNDDEATKRRVSQSTQTTGSAARDSSRFQQAYNGFQKLVSDVETLSQNVKGQTDKIAVLENKQQAVEHFTVVLNQEVDTLSNGVGANTSKGETTAAKVEETRVLMTNLYTDVGKLVKNLSAKVKDLTTKVDSMANSEGSLQSNQATTDIEAIKEELSALNKTVEVMKGHKTVNLKKLQKKVSELHKFTHVFFDEINGKHLKDIYQKVEELCLVIQWQGFTVEREEGAIAPDDKEDDDEEFFYFPENAGLESHET